MGKLISRRRDLASGQSRRRERDAYRISDGRRRRCEQCGRNDFVLWIAQKWQRADRTRYLPEYTADGQLLLPKDFHEWVYVGSPLTPNALNGGQANFPEFH